MKLILLILKGYKFVIRNSPLYILFKYKTS
jgi:hypothetical protein